MIINKLIPQGYCRGVICAINIAKNNKNYKRPIYSLGALIHNKEMIKELEKDGIITIENGKSRLEMLDEIFEGSVIISAHGSSPEVYAKAIAKGLDIIDATCLYVKKTHDEIIKYLSLGYDIYYIGTKNHPECEGALGIDKNIKLISNLNDLDGIVFKDKSFIINQTTLSIFDIKEIHNKILEKNKNVIISNSICDATTKRQEAVINAKKVDLTIVVGDTKSSNTKKLYLLAQKNNKAIQIENKNDLINFDFTNISEVNITSGASTPKYIVDEVIEYLKEKK